MPSLLDAPKPRRVSKSLYRRWNWRRQVVASGLRLVAMALLALLGWGGWYLANKGFGRQWRTTVADELRGLAELHESGVLTTAEYDQAKAKVIAS